MRPLDGRAAIVTGAGAGLGRSHALHLASLGAAVVVNDVAKDADGQWRADRVVDEITDQGMKAIVNHADVSHWSAAADLVGACVDAFGRLDVLVNNAGIVRDRTMARMTENEWDDVLRVDLKGHAAPSIHAMRHWRRHAKTTGDPVGAAIVHTSSIGGLMANFGQGNYVAAKLGVVGLSSVLALEGEQIGVRSNVIAPSARTETTLQAMPSTSHFDQPDGITDMDFWDPGNVSPVVGWLTSPSCAATGQIFHVVGNEVRLFAPFSVVNRFTTIGRWTLEDLDRQVGPELTRWPTAMEFLEVFEQKASVDG
jgi:NAD(P)-dependent dehydrogenase (short-subunit alcohol dehydrogenase family)